MPQFRPIPRLFDGFNHKDGNLIIPRDTQQNHDTLTGNASPKNDAVSHILRWTETARRHDRPNTQKSIRQLLTTIPPLIGLWIAMIVTVGNNYWLTLLLSIPAAAFTVRLFIIQHDCGHRSFFNSARLSDWLGNLIGVITLTPHEYWRRSHNLHHATCGNLDKRGIGDVSVLTVTEYLALSRWKRIGYRIYRHPATMLGIAPLYLFVFKYRLPLDLIRRHPKVLISVMGTNLAIAGVFTGLSLGFGITNILLVQAPIVVLSSTVGVWLFYIQHQFENTYWRRDEQWDFHEAAVRASSFYDLPQPLRWFSADIGIHHLHHLCSRIPNYRLRACLDDLPALQTLNRISLRESLSCMRLTLWDEHSQRLISFKNFLQREPAPHQEMG